MWIFRALKIRETQVIRASRIMIHYCCVPRKIYSCVLNWYEEFKGCKKYNYHLEEYPIRVAFLPVNATLLHKLEHS